MRKTIRKSAIAAVLLLLPLAGRPAPQDLKDIKLPDPDKTRGLPLMEALSLRCSDREWSDAGVSLRDLSDMLWAANGINRPETKKRTAPSAQNAQDIDVYVLNRDGAYLYEPVGHALVPVAAGDFRSMIMLTPGSGVAWSGTRPGAKGAGGPPSTVPIHLILVSDLSRFDGGSPEMRMQWAAIDAGIVSQNVSLFCAATGLCTRPRASIVKDRIREFLKLRESQVPLMNHPVGHPRE